MTLAVLAALATLTCLDGTMGEGSRLRRVVLETTTASAANLHLHGREIRTLPLLVEWNGDTLLTAKTPESTPDSLRASLQLRRGGDTYRGVLQYRGNAHPLALDAAVPASGAWATGSIRGVTHASGFPMRLGVRLSPGPCGTVHGWIDSPEQGRLALPLTHATIESRRAVLRAGYLGLELTLFERDGAPALAVLSQGGMTDTFAVEPGDVRASVSRSQEPTRPLPYDEREVVVRSGALELHGTLTIPGTPGRHPAALLLGGSGPQDRDESVAGHRPFFLLADQLTRSGWAVLRLDDRGVGRSGGRTLDASIDDLAADARHAVEWLTSHAAIDPRRVVLVGHSEGGYVALRAARLLDGSGLRPAGIVLLNGPSLRGDELLRTQFGAAARADGSSPKTVRIDSLLVAASLRGVVKSAKGARGDLVHHVEREIATLRRSLGALDRVALDSTLVRRSPQRDSTTISLWRTRWFRSFVTHDPVVDLKALSIPLLAIHGEFDVQVPVTPNVEAPRRIISPHSRSRVEISILPRLNHLLQTATSGRLSEYSRIEETLAPAAIDSIRGFLGRLAENPARL